ncbi:MAG: hypothetical protein KIT79_15345 [Deltaproteobacteria bacterium]|nr:hypothetical protein [Deltaproteobacteria bacterium]
MIRLITSAVGRLADTKARIVLLLRNQSVLARQTQRIGEFARRHPEIRVDWLAYGTGIRELESRIDRIIADETALRTDLKTWIDRNFGSEPAVKIDLEPLGIRNLSGELPLEPLLNLGDGTVTSLAGRIFDLQSRVRTALALIDSLQHSHAETLRRVREVVAGKPEILKDLDGVIAANEADRITGMGTDPGIYILSGLAAWFSWKLYRWASKPKETSA